MEFRSMISNMDDKSKPKRGGARKGAGRPAKIPGEPMVHITVTVDEATVRKLAVLGGENVSEGVRRAADVAYDRYLRS